MRALHAEEYLGAELFSRDGESVGEVAGVYVTAAGEPAFATVDTEETNNVLIPLAGAEEVGPLRVEVSYSAAMIRTSPVVLSRPQLNEAQLRATVDHFSGDEADDTEDEPRSGGPYLPPRGPVYFRAPDELWP